MTRTDVVSRIKGGGIIPAIRSSDPVEATNAAEAIRLGGIPVIEISLAPPDALEVLEQVAKHSDDMIVGAGTVINPDDVERAKSAGAQFVVTPGFSEETVEKAIELEMAIFVGAITPTEVLIAYQSRADAIKLYPCSAMGGPRYVKVLRSQFPNVDLIASGGVSLDNTSDYIRAGACAIGVGGEIADTESIAAGSHRIFTVRAKRFREAVNEARLLWEASRTISVGEGR